MASYSNKHLKSIKEVAALFFTPREIAIMLEFDAEIFVADCNIEYSEAWKAFQSGRLQAEVDLRTGILKMAKAGSSPAQTMALEILQKSTVKLKDR